MKKTITTIAFGLLGLSLSAQVPNYVPTNGLLSYYSFEGNANDVSGASGNNGAVNGATLTTDRFGNVNSAYNFDGINDNVLVQMNSNLAPSGKQNYTYSLWFQGNPGNGTLIQIFTGTSGANISNYDLGYGSSKINFNHYNFVNNTISPDTTARYIWTNILVDINQVNDSVKLYKNGFFWYKGKIGALEPSAGLLSIGALINNTDPFKGKIDDIGIWGRSLTQQEISNLYNGNICYQNITVTDTLLINTGITGFNPITYKNTIKVWPNPTNDHITIDNGNIANLAGYQIKITNSLSQQVFQSAITQQQFYVDLSTWTGNGIYFVHIIDAQGNTIDIKKIVLQ